MNSTSIDSINQHMIILIKKPPYDGENSFAALSNLFVNLDKDVKTVVIFLFNGVWNLLPGQNSEKLTNFPNIEALILYHQELRPLLTFQDVYKLLYQGVFGI